MEKQYSKLNSKDLEKQINTLLINKHTIKKIKEKYNIQNENVIRRLIALKKKFELQKQINMDYDELLIFLEKVMKYDTIHLWLLEQQFQNKKPSLNEKLDKLFKLKTDTDILKIYDIEQNIKRNNEKILKKEFRII